MATTGEKLTPQTTFDAFTFILEGFSALLKNSLMKIFVQTTSQLSGKKTPAATRRAKTSFLNQRPMS